MKKHIILVAFCILICGCSSKEKTLRYYSNHIEMTENLYSKYIKLHQKTGQYYTFKKSGTHFYINIESTKNGNVIEGLNLNNDGLPLLNQDKVFFEKYANFSEFNEVFQLFKLTDYNSISTYKEANKGVFVSYLTSNFNSELEFGILYCNCILNQENSKKISNNVFLIEHIVP